MRLADVSKNGKIIIDKKLIVLIVLIGIVTNVLLSFFFLKYFLNVEVNYIILFLLTFATSITMFYYNILRIKKDFSIAQLINNSWKYLLLIIGLLFLFKQLQEASYLIEIFGYIFIIISILFTAYILKKVHFNFTKKIKMKTILTYSFHFTLSMLSLTFIGFFDRFFIKGAFGSEQFGNYFYLSTIFYFPFSLLQGYVGFKELVYFKTDASILILRKKLININWLSLLLGILILVLSIIAEKFKIIPAVSFSRKLVSNYCFSPFRNIENKL